MAAIELDDIEKETAELKTYIEDSLKAIRSGNLAPREIFKVRQALPSKTAILQMRNLGAAQSLPGVPPEFLCPVSHKIMKEPVYLTTSRVFDRSSILKWVHDMYETCDESELEVVLSSFCLTPHEELRESIFKWCEGRLELMLKRLSSSSLTDMKAAAKEIRQLTENSKDTRVVFGENNIDVVDILFEALSGEHIFRNHDLREDLIAIVFNLSLDDTYKKIFLKMPLVADLLTQSLSRGTIVSRRTAAATISSIVTDDDTNHVDYGIGGAFTGLAGILKEKNDWATRDAVNAMWKLCYHCSTNREWAVEDGVIRIIMEEISEISNSTVYGVLLAVILMLLDTYTNPNVVEQLGGNEGARVLINMLEKGGNTEEIRELCVKILRMQCEFDNTIVKMIKEDDVFLKKIHEFSRTAKAVNEADKIRLLTQQFNNPPTLERGEDD